MSNPGTVSLAEHQALWQRTQNVEQRERELLKERDGLKRELHRWQTGTEIESDYIPHWVTRSEFEAVSEERDRLKRELSEREENKRSLIGAIEASNRKLEEQLKLERDGLRKELSEKDSTIARLGENLTNLEQLRVEELQLKAQECLKLRGELAEAKADSKAPAWDQYHAAHKRASDLQSVVEGTKLANRSLHEERARLNKELTEKKVKADRLKQAWREAEKRAVELIADNDRLRSELAEARNVDSLKEDRDRLRKHLTEVGAKGANYKLKVEIERLEQRVKALEGSRRGSPTAALEIFDQLRELERRIVSHVLDVTAHGSTLSADMCRRHGVDPDELIGGEDENESDE